MRETKIIPSYAEGLRELRDNLSEMLPAPALQVFDKDALALNVNHTSVLKLTTGDQAPGFTLTDATGAMVSLSGLLEKGRVVLVFYRGTWCPYCNLQLNQYQQILAEIKALGGQLVAISPQTPDESLNIKEKNQLQFTVLSDVGNKVARQFTTVFRNDDAPVNTMTELGFDFDSHYADDSREIPVPAVFIIEQDGNISFARSEGGDYRQRVEPAAIITALQR